MRPAWCGRLTSDLSLQVMCYTYSRVGLELWGSRAIGEASEAQSESIKSKRKVSAEEHLFVPILSQWPGTGLASQLTKRKLSPTEIIKYPRSDSVGLFQSAQHSAVDILMLELIRSLSVISGGKNDDDGSPDLHSLLAALSHLLHHSRHLPRN